MYSDPVETEPHASLISLSAGGSTSANERVREGLEGGNTGVKEGMREHFKGGKTHGERKMGR